MPRDQINSLMTQNIEKDAAVLLAKIEKALTAVAPFSSPTDNASNTISNEFVSLCLQPRSARRDDVNIALEQMQVLLERLPLPILVQNSDFLTLRTLLQVALETQNETPRLCCNALGFLYLQRRDANEKDERTSEVQGELLAFFLMQPRRPWSHEQIFEELWPQKDLQRAQWSFHTARKRLHEFAGEEVILKLKRGQYSLNPNLAIWFDVTEFESLLTRAYTLSNATARRKLLEGAVQLYRGDFLEKNYKDWVVPIRSHLREKYISALLQLDELTQEEAPEQAIAWYEKALHADDLNEDAYLKLMQLHLQSNNSISAHRTFVLCMDTFQRETGTKPGITFLQAIRSLIGDIALTNSSKDGRVHVE